MAMANRLFASGVPTDDSYWKIDFGEASTLFWNHPFIRENVWLIALGVFSLCSLFSESPTIMPNQHSPKVAEQSSMITI